MRRHLRRLPDLLAERDEAGLCFALKPSTSGATNVFIPDWGGGGGDNRFLASLVRSPRAKLWRCLTVCHAKRTMQVKDAVEAWLDDATHYAKS